MGPFQPKICLHLVIFQSPPTWAGGGPGATTIVINNFFLCFAAASEAYDTLDIF